MKPKITVQGHLRMTKKYLDEREDQVVLDDPNIITIGMAQFVIEVLMGEADPDIPANQVSLGFLQLGTSSQDNWATNYLYELSSPASLSEYGEHTSLHIEEIPQVTYTDPFNKTGFEFKNNAFINLEKNGTITKLSDSTIAFTVLIDENTLNGLDITEAGLFYNTAQESTRTMQLGAYKAFGYDDGLGIVASIPKSKDFMLQIEWILTINVEFQSGLSPEDSGDTYRFYKSPHENPNGNSWVCYFPDITRGDEPVTKYSLSSSDFMANIEEQFVVRCLQNGLSVFVSDYIYPSASSLDISGPIFTSAYDSNEAFLPSSTSPLRMPSGVSNCFTDGAKAIQFAKEHGSTYWNLNPSNVFVAGNGFGSTIAGWLGYGPDGAGTGGVDEATYEVCSTRPLAVVLRRGVMDWNSWYPYTLSTFDFRMAGIPKQVGMYGSELSAVADGGVLMSSSTDYYDADFITSSISSIGSLSSLLFSSDDMVANTDAFYWSGIPTLKELYQWRELPTIAKQYWSPRYQASALGDNITFVDGAGGVHTQQWGHADNATTYCHLSYAGASTSSTGLAYIPDWRVYEVSSNSYLSMGNVSEPAVNIDLSGNVSFASSIDDGKGMDYQTYSPYLSQDMNDVMQANLLYGELLDTANVSSVVEYYSPTKNKTIRSSYVSGSTDTYKVWDLNNEATCNRDRVEWMIRVALDQDSWYTQFLGNQNAIFPHVVDHTTGEGYNVVLIFVDDMGIDQFGAYDYANTPSGNPYTGLNPFASKIYPQTTTLSAMAAGGMLFTQARATSICAPSRANLLTGKNAFSSPRFYDFDAGTNPKDSSGYWGHGIAAIPTNQFAPTLGGLQQLGAPHEIFDKDGIFRHLSDLIISESGDVSYWGVNNFTILPQLIRQKGYYSAMVGKWHLTEWDQISSYREAGPGNNDTGGDPGTYYSISGLGWDGLSAVGKWDSYKATFGNLNKTPIPGKKNWSPKTAPSSVWEDNAVSLGLSDVNMTFVNFFTCEDGNIVTTSDAGYTSFVDSNATPRQRYAQGAPEKFATYKQFSDASGYFNTAPEPFFLYVSLNAVHSPYTYPPSSLVYTSDYNGMHPQELMFEQGSLTQGNSASATWVTENALIENMDIMLGRFLDQIDADRKQRTLFLFMGDNGTMNNTMQNYYSYASGNASTKGGLGIAAGLGSEYEKLINPQELPNRLGKPGACGGTANTNTISFKGSMYDRGVLVPLIASANFIEQQGYAGSSVSAMVDIIDVYATIADISRMKKEYVSLEPGNSTRWEGYSFLPILSGSPTEGHSRQFSFHEYYTPIGNSGLGTSGENDITAATRGNYSGYMGGYTATTSPDSVSGPGSVGISCGTAGNDPTIPVSRARAFIVRATSATLGNYNKVSGSVSIPGAAYAPLNVDASAGMWKIVRPVSGADYDELYHLRNWSGSGVDPYELHDLIPQAAKGHARGIRGWFLENGTESDATNKNWQLCRIYSAVADSLDQYLIHRTDPSTYLGS